MDDDEIAEVGRLYGHIGQLCEDSSVVPPFDGDIARSLDNISFAHWCEQEIQHPVIMRLAESLTQGLLGVEPTEVSALYIVNYIKSGTGLTNLGSDLEDGGQYLRVRKGKCIPNSYPSK